MNTKAPITASDSLRFPIIDEMITKTRSEINDLARKDGRHLGKENIPSLDTSTYAPHVIEIKTRCESLITEVLQILMPSSIFPEAKMEADYHKETDKALDEKIKS